MRYIGLIFVIAWEAGLCQVSGFQAVSLPVGARNAALGGYVVSLADGDLTQFMHNPAVLDSVAFTDAAVTYSPYFAGVHHFTGVYYVPFRAIGGLAVGLSYLDYGDFAGKDPNGDDTGNFSARDYVVTVGKSHSVGPFTLGANLKFANSAIESYGASVLLADLGGIYRYPGSDFSIGIVFKNLGFVLSDYVTEGLTKVPFDVQIGASVKPEHMPFRFTLTGYNLTREHLVFTREREEENLSGTVKAFDHILRRINFGAELILHKNVQLLFGYNHLRRQELKLEDIGGGAGFSFGFLIGIKKFKFRYSHSTYHAAGGANFFTLQTNLHAFKKIL